MKLKYIHATINYTNDWTKNPLNKVISFVAKIGLIECKRRYNNDILIVDG